ncbi:MAG TPA: hypothetical protein VN634_17110 [Candidatus Limnocylindrales bacterium]|nr:hypothetical protein [Candidatus Limnocylindrales bacterium]
MAALSLVVAGNAAADDVSGHWYVALDPPSFADIAQTESAITLTWTEDATTYDFAGTISGDQISATDSPYQLNATIGSSHIYGYVVESGVSARFRELFRCECFDGNAVSGDGCDSRCRLEPCFDCSGDPSVCTPMADSTTCDDGNDCTQGEMCTSGVCGGGSLLDSCVDLTGLWRVIFDMPGYAIHSVHGDRYEQRGGRYHDYGDTIDPDEFFTPEGVIVPATGAMSSQYPGSFPWYCEEHFNATASLDNLRFSGGGISYASTPHGCVGFPYTVVANRCDEAAGCFVTDCSGIADGLACEDGDPCTKADICSAGDCTGGPSPCGLCEVCEADGSCVYGPRTDCLETTRATGSMLQLASSGAGKLRFSWKKGVAVGVADIGDPPTDETGLCVFDEASPSPALVLQQPIRPGFCDTASCWTVADDRVTYKSHVDDQSGTLTIALQGGGDGESSLTMKARGYLLDTFPATPVATPLRAQFQIRNGTCFEAEFLSDGVRSNADGKFRASGGTQ